MSSNAGYLNANTSWPRGARLGFSCIWLRAALKLLPDADSRAISKGGSSTVTIIVSTSGTHKKSFHYIRFLFLYFKCNIIFSLSLSLSLTLLPVELSDSARQTLGRSEFSREAFFQGVPKNAIASAR